MSTLESKPESKVVITGSAISALQHQDDVVNDEVHVDLDPAVLQFLLSSRYQASNVALKKNFNLSDEDIIFISDLDRLVMAREVELEAYLVTLEDRFSASMADEQRDALYAQLLAERFVPLGEWLTPSALEVARTEELKLPQVPHFQVYFKPLTYSGAATEVAETAGFSLLGAQVRERLRELIVSKIKGVRTDAQVVEVLTRGLDFGGLGLDRTTAGQTLVAMNDILKRAKVVSEDEYAAWLSEEARKKAAPPAIATNIDPDAQEIATIQAKMSQVQPSNELDRAIEVTLSRLPYHPDDEYLAKRLRNVLSSRLRDVRNALEVRQLLMRDVKVGGLGVSAADADALTRQIEAAYQEFHVTIAAEEKHKIEGQLEDQQRKIEERRQREAEEHARWFEEKIRSRKASEVKATTAMDELRRAVTAVGPTTPLDIKQQKLETEKFGPLVPTSSPVSVPVTPFVGADRGVRPSEGQTQRLAPTQSIAPSVKVSPATLEIAQATAGERPSLDGVAYAGPQLVGLIGELKAFSVPEFRRLSKDPQEAAKKLRQKIETLSQESFEKKMEGIRAFQASPLQAAYLSIVGESFRSSTPVAVLAESKRKAGADTLSADEIAAVMSLNSALHF